MGDIDDRENKYSLKWRHRIRFRTSGQAFVSRCLNRCALDSDIFLLVCDVFVKAKIGFLRYDPGSCGCSTKVLDQHWLHGNESLENDKERIMISSKCNHRAAECFLSEWQIVKLSLVPVPIKDSRMITLPNVDRFFAFIGNLTLRWEPSRWPKLKEKGSYHLSSCFLGCWKASVKPDLITIIGIQTRKQRGNWAIISFNSRWMDWSSFRNIARNMLWIPRSGECDRRAKYVTLWWHDI